jgi:hypothetical protein
VAAVPESGATWLREEVHVDLPGTGSAAWLSWFERASAGTHGHLELAAYKLLRHVAHHASDQETVELASSIGAQERSMGERLAENFERLESRFDVAIDASLRVHGVLA